VRPNSSPIPYYLPPRRSARRIAKRYDTRCSEKLYAEEIHRNLVSTNSTPLLDPAAIYSIRPDCRRPCVKHGIAQHVAVMREPSIQLGRPAGDVVRARPARGPRVAGIGEQPRELLPRFGSHRTKSRSCASARGSLFYVCDPRTFNVPACPIGWARGAFSVLTRATLGRLTDISIGAPLLCC